MFPSRLRQDKKCDFEQRQGSSAKFDKLGNQCYVFAWAKSGWMNININSCQLKVGLWKIIAQVEW